MKIEVKPSPEAANQIAKEIQAIVKLPRVKKADALERVNDIKASIQGAIETAFYTGVLFGRQNEGFNPPPRDDYSEGCYDTSSTSSEERDT